MAFSLSPARSSFKFFDPDNGFVSADSYGAFTGFLKRFLGDGVGPAWSIYSYF